MEQRKVFIKNHELVIKQGDQYSIRIDLHLLFEDMSEEERQQMAMSITWDAIMDEAVKRLTYKSDFWQGDDPPRRLKILSEVEDVLLSGFRWIILGGLDKYLSNMVSHNHLYWKMYHDPQHGDFFTQWLRENKIESNYGPKLADVESLKKFVESKFDELINIKANNAQSSD